MNAPPEAEPETEDIEEIVRFLHRFSELVSKGTNADNLRRAAEFLEAHVKMSRESRELLRIQRNQNDTNVKLCKSLGYIVARLENETIELKSELARRKFGLNQAIRELEQERDQLASRAEQAEARSAAVQSRDAVLGDTHVIVPISALRLAESQFMSFARAFEKSGNVVSQAMCEASATALDQVLLDAKQLTADPEPAV
jgi:hypothetical protein